MPSKFGKSSKSAEISDKITLIIFKDHFAARTFQIPLQWILRFGLLVSAVAIIGLLGSIYAVQYHLLAHRTDPSRVKDLELELSDLKTALKTMESKTIEIHSPLTANTPRLPSTPNATPLATTPSLLFTAFPHSVSGVLAHSQDIHISIQNPKIKWNKNILNVGFALQYALNKTKADNPIPQHGTIVVLARGAETLLVYPSGVLGRAGTSPLITPSEGESFSITRYREVNADFGPVKSQDALKEIEILIFDQEGQLLIYQNIPTEGLES